MASFAESSKGCLLKHNKYNMHPKAWNNMERQVANQKNLKFRYTAPLTEPQ